MRRSPRGGMKKKKMERKNALGGACKDERMSYCRLEKSTSLKRIPSYLLCLETQIGFFSHFASRERTWVGRL